MKDLKNKNKNEKSIWGLLPEWMINPIDRKAEIYIYIQGASWGHNSSNEELLSHIIPENP